MSDQSNAARAAQRAQRTVERQDERADVRRQSSQVASKTAHPGIPGKIYGFKPPQDQLKPVISKLNETLGLIPKSLESLTRIRHIGRHAMPAQQQAPYSAEFHRQLGRLCEHGVNLAHAGAALQMWHRILGAVVPPEPLVELTNDGGLRFAWSTAQTYLDIQVYPDLSTEWFFVDRASGDVEGTEDDREATLSPRFLARLRLFGEA